MPLDDQLATDTIDEVMGFRDALIAKFSQSAETGTELILGGVTREMFGRFISDRCKLSRATVTTQIARHRLGPKEKREPSVTNIDRKAPDQARRALPPKRAIEILKKLIEDAQTIPRESWTSPKRDGWKDTAQVALEQAGVSNSLLQSFGRAQTIAFNTDSSDEEMREKVNSNLAGMVAVLQSAINALSWELNEDTPLENRRPIEVKPTVSIFISHSSKDANVAFALIELLRAALGRRAEDIRCSSVDGYRLPGGANTEQQLRQEVNTATAFIGLITTDSLASPYVMFELGARWGAGLHMLPLLAGVDAGYIKGPLSGINALSCSSDAQVHQMLTDIARELSLSVGAPAAYVTYVKRLVELVKTR